MRPSRPTAKRGLASRMAHPPSMFFKQARQSHFPPVSRLPGQRVPGSFAPPVSRPCLEIRPAQLAPDRQVANLSWNPGPARGSDPSLLASHLNGPWHVIYVQEGSGFVTDSSLAENFYVITQHHCAVLLNQGHVHARHLLYHVSNPMFSAVRDMGCCRHGGHWQVTQGTRPVVLLLYCREHPRQQRVRQAEVRLYCPAPLGLGLVSRAAHRRLSLPHSVWRARLGSWLICEV